MARKSQNPTFEQTLDILRAHSFEVAPSGGASGSVLASKYGAGAVLAAAKDGPASVVVAPGVVLGGEVSRLVDRGYQKFFKTSKVEVPATASRLQSIHHFTEELKQLIGATSLYNESLGTTSDLYTYDRLKGREFDSPASVRPWEMNCGH